MTKQQFDEKFDDIAGKVPAMLREYKRAALKSGAVDLKSEDDNYAMAKCLLCAALRDAAEQWAPKSVTNAVENIRACTYPDYTRLD